MKDNPRVVFVSYAREDIEAARRLYTDLKRHGADPWMDEVQLLPGHRFAEVIKEAIRASEYFIALLSTRSVGKRGFVQRELREALDVLAEVPSGDIYLIPARLDVCIPRDRELAKINWVDLFPSWDIGVAKILRAMSIAEKEPSYKRILKESSYRSILLDLRCLLGGERELDIKQVGGVRPYIDTLLMSSSNPEEMLLTFNRALRDIIRSWRPEDPLIYRDRLIVELIAAYTPVEGFAKVLSIVLSNGLKTSDSDTYALALSALESYYPVPSPQSSMDSAFNAYCDLLWRQLDEPGQQAHAFRRLLELGVLKPEDPIFAAVVTMPGVVQEFLQAAVGRRHQTLQRMIGTVFGNCLLASPMSLIGQSQAYQEFKKTLGLLGARLIHDNSPELVLASGEKIELFLPLNSFAPYMELRYQEIKAAGMSKLAGIEAEID